MHSRGHPLWWRVQYGEYPLWWSASPAAWALAGESGRATEREDCQGETPSGDCFTACRQPRPIDQRGELPRRTDRHNLVFRPDPHRARRATVFDVRQSDYRSTRNGGRRSVGDHRDVVTVHHDAVRLGIDDRHAPSVAVQQSAEGRSKESRAHRDEYLERWLG